MHRCTKLSARWPCDRRRGILSLRVSGELSPPNESTYGEPNVKQTIRAMLMLGLCGAAAAAQDAAKKSADLTDPVEILKKADAACKAVNFVQYTASIEGSGTQERFVGKSSGTVTLKGRGAGGAEQYRYEAKLEKPGSNDMNDVTVGSDGKTYFLIDAKAKKAYEDINPAVVGTAGRFVLRGLTMKVCKNNFAFSVWRSWRHR